MKSMVGAGEGRALSAAAVKALAAVIGDPQVQIIDGIVDELMTAEPTDTISQLMPVTSKMGAVLIHEVVSGFGGLTQERVKGEKGKAVNKSSSKQKIFLPGSYQEHILFNEQELLELRAFGSIGDRGVTGVTSRQLDHLVRAGKKLQRRLQNRIQKLSWDALVAGTYTYDGVVTDFGIPAANKINASTDWSTVATAKPFEDLSILINETAATKRLKFSKIVMNAVTASYVLRATVTRNFIQNNNVKNLDINEVAKFYMPGLPPIEVVRDSYQDESIVAGEVVLGDATYFVPDDKVLLIPDLSRAEYAQMGEFQITPNLNDPSATLDRPATGIYVFTDEKGLENRENPHVKVVGGFNGGANLKRPNDIIVVST